MMDARMWKRLSIMGGILFALGILVVSVFRAADTAAYSHIMHDSVRPTHSPEQASQQQIAMEHNPSHPGYYIKIIGQQIERYGAAHGQERARVYLDLAADRLETATVLREALVVEHGLKTATKGVGYLSMAAEELSSEQGVAVDKMRVELESLGYVYEDLVQNYKGVTVGYENAAMDSLCTQIEDAIALAQLKRDKS